MIAGCHPLSIPALTAGRRWAPKMHALKRNRKHANMVTWVVGNSKLNMLKVFAEWTFKFWSQPSVQRPLNVKFSSIHAGHMDAEVPTKHTYSTHFTIHVLLLIARDMHVHDTHQKCYKKYATNRAWRECHWSPNKHEFRVLCTLALSCLS